MGTIKDTNSKDLKEASFWELVMDREVCCSPWGQKELNMTEQLNWTENYARNVLMTWITTMCGHSPRVRHPGVWSQAGLGSITTNKASGGDGIPAEVFQILKDDVVKVLYSICQQIWKTQQCPQHWKRSVFIPVPKKGNAKESKYSKIALISHGLQGDQTSQSERKSTLNTHWKDWC